jgi:hypothetical protein
MQDEFKTMNQLTMIRLLTGIALMMCVTLPAHGWGVNGSGCSTNGTSSSGVDYGGASGGYSAWSHSSSVVCGSSWQGGIYYGPYGGMVGVQPMPPVNQASPYEQQPDTRPIPIGSQFIQLPANCGKAMIHGVDYYQCGPNWFRPHAGNDSVYYEVVQAPY